MIYLYEDQILHSDSSLDILEHYGVKGMRWGVKRRARKLLKKGDKIVQKRVRQKGIPDEESLEKQYRKEMYKELRTKGTSEESTKNFKNGVTKYKSHYRRELNKLIKENPKYKDYKKVEDLAGEYSTNKWNYYIQKQTVKGLNPMNRMARSTVGQMAGNTLSAFSPIGSLATSGVGALYNRQLTKKVRKKYKEENRRIVNQLRNYV